MLVSTLARETVATGSVSPALHNALLRNVEPTRPSTLASLPRLPLVPEWSQVLRFSLEAAPGLPELQAWRIELRHTPVRQLGVREVYTALVTLPRLDRVGRFVHIDLPMLLGLSAGAELLRLAPQPPREDYSSAQELTPGCGLWYKPSGSRWAAGIFTGTRFLIAQHSGTVVDPFTSEARWALFLP